jgi:protein-tyrosine phosphatase
MARKILCVCKGNTCRSPMFAAVLERKLREIGRDDIVESAGYLESAKGQPAAKEWEVAKVNTKVDLSNHRSRWIGDLDLMQYDLILTMEPQAMMETIRKMPQPRDIRLVNPAEEGIFNPWQHGQDAYNKCHGIICQVVEDLAPRLWY